MNNEHFDDIAAREVDQHRRSARIASVLILASVLVIVALAIAIRLVGLTW